MPTRIYTDSQRAAMFALHEQGYKPAEIARRCSEGLASCAPFEVPRTSVRDICSAIERERGRRAPRSLDDIEGANEIKKFPERTVRIVNAEYDRLEAKQRTKPLDLNDLSKLSKLERLGDQIHRSLRAPGRAPAQPTSTGSGNGAASSPTVERLARAMWEESESR